MPDSKSGRQWQRQMSIEDAGVLEQRVYHIEKAVADQAAQTQSLISQLAQTVNSQIQQVQQTTSQQISALAQQIGNLGTKLEERAKIPWPALAVMLSFLVVIGGLVWYPISENLRDTRIAVKELDRDLTTGYVTVREYNGRTGALSALRDAQMNNLIDRISRLEREIERDRRKE